jgi:hypothetical protein
MEIARKENMKKKSYPLVALLVLVATALACAFPPGGQQLKWAR